MNNRQRIMTEVEDGELVKYVFVKTGHDILGEKKLHKYQEVMDVRIADMVLFDFPNIITVILIFGIFATGVMYTKKQNKY